MINLVTNFNCPYYLKYLFKLKQFAKDAILKDFKTRKKQQIDYAGHQFDLTVYTDQHNNPVRIWLVAHPPIRVFIGIVGDTATVTSETSEFVYGVKWSDKAHLSIEKKVRKLVEDLKVAAL